MTPVRDFLWKSLGSFVQKAKSALRPRGPPYPSCDPWDDQSHRIEFGSGWYHDAAIQEDAETRKR